MNRPGILIGKGHLCHLYDSFRDSTFARWRMVYAKSVTEPNMHRVAVEARATDSVMKHFKECGRADHNWLLYLCDEATFFLHVRPTVQRVEMISSLWFSSGQVDLASDTFFELIVRWQAAGVITQCQTAY